jgi:hypothetical protein
LFESAREETEEAIAQFERVLAARNDLDLLCEQYNVTEQHLSGTWLL